MVGQRWAQSVWLPSRGAEVTRRNSTNSGVHSPQTEDGLQGCETPTFFSARKGVALRDAMDPGVSGPNGIAIEMHADSVPRDHASARQLTRDPADTERRSRRRFECLVEVLRQREAGRTAEKAPN